MTSPNAVVEMIHPNPMPVILTTDEERDVDARAVGVEMACATMLAHLIRRLDVARQPPGLTQGRSAQYDGKMMPRSIYLMPIAGDVTSIGLEYWHADRVAISWSGFVQCADRNAPPHRPAWIEHENLGAITGTGVPRRFNPDITAPRASPPPAPNGRVHAGSFHKWISSGVPWCAPAFRCCL